MPRVTIKKREYKATDFSKWLVGRMYELGISQKTLGEYLGLQQPAVSIKIERGTFTYADILIIIDKLGATDEEIVRMMRM